MVSYRPPSAPQDDNTTATQTSWIADHAATQTVPLQPGAIASTQTASAATLTAAATNTTVTRTQTADTQTAQGSTSEAAVQVTSGPALVAAPQVRSEIATQTNLDPEPSTKTSETVNRASLTCLLPPAPATMHSLNLSFICPAAYACGLSSSVSWPASAAAPGVAIAALRAEQPCSEEPRLSNPSNVALVF